MKTVFGSAKAIAIASSAMLFASIGWLAIEKRANSTLKESLTHVNLKLDSLTTESNVLKDDVQKYRGVVDSLFVKNDKLDKALNQAASKLSARENEFRKEKAALKQMQREKSDLTVSRNDLEKQLATLKTSLARLQQENKLLSSQVTSLGENNALLNTGILKARITSVDNTDVEAMNKANKLNIKARRVRKIVANFTVRTEIKAPKLSLFDSNGQMLTERDGNFAWKLIPESKLPNENDGMPKAFRMEVTYVPAKRLRPGIYTLEIQNENLHLGNLLLRLR